MKYQNSEMQYIGIYSEHKNRNAKKKRLKITLLHLMSWQRALKKSPVSNMCDLQIRFKWGIKITMILWNHTILECSNAWENLINFGMRFWYHHHHYHQKRIKNLTWLNAVHPRILLVVSSINYVKIKIIKNKCNS